MSNILREKSEKPDICPGCQGYLRGAKIKSNLKDIRECQGCNIYNKLNQG
jgi:hypothetical protein